MSETTATQAKSAKDEKAAFSLDVSEQELLDEFGILLAFEYTYGA